MHNTKVFGIGFHKTGTTSVGHAFSQLGYRVCGPVGVRNPRIRDQLEQIAMPVVPRFDAFQDNPWPLLYRVVDEKYPGSKFVLTVRPPHLWIQSVVKHFGGQSTPMRELIYGPGRGDPRGNEDHYLEVYNAHNEAVKSYFQGRESDLLVLRLTEGEGWEQLCRFLDKPVPAGPFPTANTIQDRQRKEKRRAVRNWLHQLRGKLASVLGGAESR